MRTLALTSVLAAVAIALPLEDNGDPHILDCLLSPCVTVPGYGKIKGSMKSSEHTGRDIYSYYSLRYAEPTTGDLRFRPPVKAAPLNDGNKVHDGTYTTYILNALDGMCPQAGDSSAARMWEMEMKANYGQDFDSRGIIGPMVGSEDCLSLAVFTPAEPETKAKLPVMLFIHGGAFYMGGVVGQGPRFLLEHDVVLVEIQYRLGPLGYMCLDDDDAAGNMGMMDQAMALDWVVENIAAFGGDPNQITIFGESAGSASVTYHQISDMSNKKFQRIIGESGSALNGWAFDWEPERHAKNIAELAGCPTDTTQNLINCMKNEKSAEDIVVAHSAYMKSERYNGEMGFGGTSPCAQTAGKQVFIDKHPDEYMRAGEFEPKEAFLGANLHEGSFVLGVMYNNYIVLHDIQEDEFFLRNRFIPVMLSALGLDDSSGVIYQLLQYTYFEHEELGVWDRMMPGMINLVGTFFIKSGTYEFMKYNANAGGTSHFYSLEYVGENSLFNLLYVGNNVPPVPHGVSHADDLLYLFSVGTDLVNVFDFTEEDWKISKQMCHMWTNFATYGNPNPMSSSVAGIPTIPAWTEDEPVYLAINTEPSLKEDYMVTLADDQRENNFSL